MGRAQTCRPDKLAIGVEQSKRLSYKSIVPMKGLFIGTCAVTPSLSESSEPFEKRGR